MPQIRSQAEKYLTTVAHAHKGHLNINKPLPTITGILLSKALGSVDTEDSHIDPRKALSVNRSHQMPIPISPKPATCNKASARPTGYVPPVSRRAHLIISVMQFLEAEEKDMARELKRVKTSILEAQYSFAELKDRRSDEESSIESIAGPEICSAVAR